MESFRTSVVGNAINYLSKGKLLPYEDQKPGYKVPSFNTTPSPTSSRPVSIKGDLESQTPNSSGSLSIDNSLSNEKSLAIEEKEKVVVSDDLIIVGWTDEADPENPQNWPFAQKVIVTIAICIYTFAVYMASSIYTASIPQLIEHFDISHTQAIGGLSIYIFAYGIGPLILSPLSEIPAIGRNGVYIPTAILFTLLSIVTALSPNYSTLMAMRFFTGIFGSPALATGGASLSDIFAPMQVPYAIVIWAVGAVLGPILGPIMGNFAVVASFRWPLWIILISAGISLAVISFFLPETYEGTILLKRAQRLRKLTGNQNLRSQSEIDQAQTSNSSLLKEALLRPIILSLEPSVLFSNIYLGLAYACFYLFFESMPLVFIGIYGFSQGISGLPYLGIAVAAFITVPLYILYLKYVVERRFVKTGEMIPEDRLEAGLFASFFIPVALLVYGWSSRESVHWIVPVIGSALYFPGLFLLFQSILTYLPMSYQRYAASILAGNDFFRSTVASAFPLFGEQYYSKLGVGKGNTILAAITALMIPILWLIKKKGAYLRARSKYATN